MGRLFSFPNPVNEWAARFVASGVTLLCGATIIFGWYWLTIVLAFGFLARLASGPRYSPLGRFAVWLADDQGIYKPVPGPPKRFAQGIGAVLSVAAVVLYFGFSLTFPTIIVVLLIQTAAFAESALGYCLGCSIFGWLMRRGVIPADVCLACNDLTASRT